MSKSHNPSRKDNDASVNEDTQLTSDDGISQTDAIEIDSINAESSPLAQESKEPDADSTSELIAELEKCKKDFLYLRADFDNYKKNAIRERSELIKFGSERVFCELLEVIDNFERALSIDLSPENIETYRAGIQLTAAEFKKVLSRFGVSEVESAGSPFDPSMHEALSSEPTDSVAPGHVLRVFKKAYKLHDRVLRPAQVVVAKAPEKKM